MMKNITACGIIKYFAPPLGRIAASLKNNSARVKSRFFWAAQQRSRFVFFLLKCPLPRKVMRFQESEGKQTSKERIHEIIIASLGLLSGDCSGRWQWDQAFLPYSSD